MTIRLPAIGVDVVAGVAVGTRVTVGLGVEVGAGVLSTTAAVGEGSGVGSRSSLPLHAAPKSTSKLSRATAEDMPSLQFRRRV
jgi:tetrahydrodipicolinate N-succinyltransferase